MSRDNGRYKEVGPAKLSRLLIWMKIRRYWYHTNGNERRYEPERQSMEQKSNPPPLRSLLCDMDQERPDPLRPIKPPMRLPHLLQPLNPLYYHFNPPLLHQRKQSFYIRLEIPMVPIDIIKCRPPPTPKHQIPRQQLYRRPDDGPPPTAPSDCANCPRTPVTCL